MTLRSHFQQDAAVEVGDDQEERTNLGREHRRNPRGTEQGTTSIGEAGIDGHELGEP